VLGRPTCFLESFRTILHTTTWSISTRSAKGPSNVIWRRRCRKSRSVVSPMHFFIRLDACFYPAHPIQILSGGGGGGPGARGSLHGPLSAARLTLCRLHSPVSSLSRRITAPTTALLSGAASRRFGTRASINARHACTPAARRAYKILSRRHCWALMRRGVDGFSPSSWKPQEKGIMSTAASFSLRK
jgi:hypothetical protein